LGASAGAFLVVAVVAFVVEATGNDPTGPGVAFDAFLLAAALLLGARAPGPLRSACVTAIVLAVPLVWLFAFLGGGSVGRSELRGVYLLTILSYGLLYLLTWTKGRAIFLAGALLLFASWAGFEVAGGGNNAGLPFQSTITNPSSSNSSGSSTLSGGSTLGDQSFADQTVPAGTTTFGLPDTTTLTSTNDATDSTSAVALAIGLVFLGIGALLDRKRYEGAATPFVAVGAFETLVGAIVLGGNDSLLLGGMLAVGAGALVGLVGARGDRRRATTWIGVLAVFGGLVAVLVDIAPDSAAGVGGIAFCFALGLASIAWWLAPVLGEPNDGDNRPLPPAAPPGGSSATALPDAAAA
jgi:hypothetical protein